MANGNQYEILAVPDTSWFDKEPEKFLSRPDFIEYQKVAGVDFMDLKSPDIYTREKAQNKITSQSVIFNSIHSEHAGHKMPDVYYTHDIRVGKLAPNFNPELENLAFQFDMGDSLRRRNFALGYSILPQAIERVANRTQKPVIIYDLGSGMGLDTMHALEQINPDLVERVLNFDTNQDAILRGEKIRDYLVNEGRIKKDVIKFYNHTLTKPHEVSKGKAGIVKKIGVVCGLKNPIAQGIFNIAAANLIPGGESISSSSNFNMLYTDPLPSFLIQNIGSSKDTSRSWGLTCRREEIMRDLITNAGLNVQHIYDDANFPGREDIEEEIRSGIDTLVEEALFPGKPNPYKSFFDFPPREVLDKKIGYNWLAIGLKE